MAEHAAGIAKAEIVDRVAINACQPRAFGPFYDHGKGHGPILHPVHGNGVQPTLSLCCSRQRPPLGIAFRLTHSDAGQPFGINACKRGHGGPLKVPRMTEVLIKRKAM